MASNANVALTKILWNYVANPKKEHLVAPKLVWSSSSFTSIFSTSFKKGSKDSGSGSASSDHRLEAPKRPWGPNKFCEGGLKFSLSKLLLRLISFWWIELGFFKQFKHFYSCYGLGKETVSNWEWVNYSFNFFSILAWSYIE